MFRWLGCEIMSRIYMFGTMLVGAAFSTALFYTGCISGAPGGTNCFEDSSFSSLEELKAQRVATLDEYLAQNALTLSPEQKAELQRDGRVGSLTLRRPVKMPSGEVQIPDGWMRALPEDHPWNTPPAESDPTFPGWFEYRIVEPLLYDPAREDHRRWADIYLKAVGRGEAGAPGRLIGFAGAGSGC
jgi:hypothetical protein